MNKKSKKRTVESAPVSEPSPDLGGPGANMGGPGGTGSDLGGTGAGTTALDAIGFQGNKPNKVAQHLKTKTAGSRRGDSDTF